MVAAHEAQQLVPAAEERIAEAKVTQVDDGTDGNGIGRVGKGDG